MSKVIIINGPSCAGKTTIAKEICSQSDNKFVHLQIDKAGEFYSTIFSKGFAFAENEIGTENNDDGLKGLFNNNRLARRKVVASILLATAKEGYTNDFDIFCGTVTKGEAFDIACGTGLITLKLAEIGLKCTGIDTSDPMLKTAKERVRNHGLDIRYLNVDMRDRSNQVVFDAFV